VILETPGIGQGDAAVLQQADVSLYVMTPEFGAASQLEKIAMLDFADVVAINKFERRGGADALRDVARQLIRNREAFGARVEEMPVFGTSAATFNDSGVTALYHHLAGLLQRHGLRLADGVLPEVAGRASTDAVSVIPPARAGYLAEIAAAVRGYHEQTKVQSAAVRRVQRLAAVVAELSADPERSGASPTQAAASHGGADGDRAAAVRDLTGRLAAARAEVAPENAALIEGWPALAGSYSGDEQVVVVRDRELRTALTRESLSGSRIPRVALPRFTDHGELLGAMETAYQRGRIQDESMLYERRKHDGTLPVIGVNTFRNPHPESEAAQVVLARGTEEEKHSQLDRVRDFQKRNQQEAQAALAALKNTARSGGNVFAVLMEAARVCSLQQVTEAFFEVGGQYRRNV
jgi:isobutyryl-CoA mutase